MHREFIQAGYPFSNQSTTMSFYEILSTASEKTFEWRSKTNSIIEKSSIYAKAKMASLYFYDFLPVHTCEQFVCCLFFKNSPKRLFLQFFSAESLC